MADQGWGDAKGPREGGADAGRNTEESSDSRQEAANVVQFPRDWIGPLDELVPIDLGPDPTACSGDAAGFWDGDISDEKSVPEPAWDETGRPDSRPPKPEVAYSRVGGRGRGRGLALAGGVVALAALALVALVSTGGIGDLGGNPQPSGSERQVRTLTRTVTTSATATAREPARASVAAPHPRPPLHTTAAAPATAGREVSASNPATGGSHGAADSVTTSDSWGSTGSGAAHAAGSGAGAGSSSGDGGSGSSEASASVCAQSPDSGCLP